MLPPFSLTNCLAIDSPIPVDSFAFSTEKYLSKIFCTVVASSDVALLEKIIFPSFFNSTLKFPLLYFTIFEKIFSNTLIIEALFNSFSTFSLQISTSGTIFFYLKIG